MIEAVLPLVGRDLDQFAILRDSLRRHRGDLARCVVVVPEADLPAARHAIGGDPFFALRGEVETLGFRPPRWGWQGIRPRRAGRWIQQLAKLRVAAASAADWCLMLDADLIAMRPPTADAMLDDGRGLVQVLPCGDHHDAWYRGSAAILGPGIQRSGVEYPVTPTLLSPDACRLLVAQLGRRFGGGWQGRLLRRLPWSEYTLYFTWLEAIGAFARYHRIVPQPVFYDPYNAVWWPHQMAGWRPHTGRDAPLFEIVQTTARADPALIRRRLAEAGA